MFKKNHMHLKPRETSGISQVDIPEDMADKLQRQQFPSNGLLENHNRESCGNNQENNPSKKTGRTRKVGDYN